MPHPHAGYASNISILQSSLPIRRETFEGREHVVVPITILMEGVHCGTTGCFFYPANELADIPASWDGIPITVFHPQQSANVPEVIEGQGVGRLFHTRFDSDGARLRGEAWIDIEKAEKVDPPVLPIIMAGKPLEVSTGLWFDPDGIPGRWNGEEYEATVRNYVPEHVALLPGSEGACSWRDGCGVRANQTQNGGEMDVILNIKSSARTPSFEGTETTSWAGVKKGFGDYRDAYYKAKGNRPDDPPARVQDAPAAMKAWIAGKTLLGEGSADNDRDLLMFPVVNPGTNKLNEGALRAVISGRGSQADIPAAAKTSAQSKARSLLNEHFGADLEAQEPGLKAKFVAALRSVAASLGLVVQEMSHEDLRSKLQQALDALDSPGWMHFVRAVFEGSVVYDARGNDPNGGVLVGAVKTFQRGYSISDSGEVTLKDDAKEVREETRYVPIEAPTGNANTNPKHKEDQAMEKKKVVDALIACNETKFEEKDRAWLDSLSEEQLGLLGINETEPAKPDEGKETPKPGEEPKKEPDPTPEKPPETPPGNEKPVTLEQYIKAAPREIQETLSRAVARDEAAKAAMIKGIMANSRNKFTEEDLKKKGIGELEQLAELAAVELDFSGQAGGEQTKVNANEAPAMPPVFDLNKKPEPAKA